MEPEERRAEPGLPFELHLWAVVLAVWAGHLTTSGLLTFPNHWDVLGYHLCLVDHWLQAESLFVPACSHWSHPANVELLCLWLVAFAGVVVYIGTFVLAQRQRPPTAPRKGKAVPEDVPASP